MSNYIDKNTFQKFLEDEIEETKCDMKNSYGDEYYEMAVESRECALREVLSKLKREPMADVQEVRHAKWMTDRFGMERSICSNCRAVYEGGDSFRFCPKCGARMFEEENNEQN